MPLLKSEGNTKTKWDQGFKSCLPGRWLIRIEIMTNTEGQTDCQCSFLARAGWFAARFDKSMLFLKFLTILRWMMFHARLITPP